MGNIIPGFFYSVSYVIVLKQIAFPDKSPYHLATEESLADLNSRIETSPNGKITMNNFRPTIIIKGTKKPWDEVKKK